MQVVPAVLMDDCPETNNGEIKSPIIVMTTLQLRKVFLTTKELLSTVAWWFKLFGLNFGILSIDMLQTGKYPLARIIRFTMGFQFFKILTETPAMKIYRKAIEYK